MKKEDLRVTRTRQLIKETFLKQICQKPVYKMTVTGLAREANINKGTFYLHYVDLYALYDEVLCEIVSGLADQIDAYPQLLTDPEGFVRAFLFSQVAPPRQEELAMLKADNLSYSTKYPMIFVDVFRDKLYAAGGLSRCRENDAKLEYMLNGMLSLLIRPGLLEKGDPLAIRFLAGSIRQLFLSPEG